MAVTDAPTEDAARHASNSSFYMAMRILPRERRESIFEIYSFCRAVDDIADGDGARPARLAQLENWRRDIRAIYDGEPPSRLRGLAAAAGAFGLEQRDFLAVIDGMEMDVSFDIRAPDFDTLDLYCDRVASAVGRLCVKVFGMEGQTGADLAYHLGRALQLTNILRDLDEDAGIGRLYLPREALEAGGIATSHPAQALSSPHLSKACAFVVERARRHFEAADAIMNRCPRRTVRTPRVMAEAYKLKLDALTARGWAAPREAIRTSRLQLLWIVLRHAVI